MIFLISPHERESKTVLYPGFHSRLRIPGTGFQSFDSGTWILGSNRYLASEADVEAGTCDEPLRTYAWEANRYWDSGYLELYIGFQMPQAKFSRIADSISKNFP